MEASSRAWLRAWWGGNPSGSTHSQQAVMEDGSQWLLPTRETSALSTSNPDRTCSCREGHSWPAPPISSTFFLRAFSEGGSGQVFYCAYGALKEIEVSEDAPIAVDNGHLVAFTDGVTYRVAPSGGMKSTMFGGEGLILELSGSGKVWIQTRNLESLVDRIIPLLPRPSN